MERLSLKVVPGSSRDEIVGWLGDSLKVKVKAPPEKGRANEAVVALLAERLGIDASSIAVVSAATGRPRRSWRSTGWTLNRSGQRCPAKSPGKVVSREPENKRVSRSGNSLIPGSICPAFPGLFARKRCSDRLARLGDTASGALPAAARSVAEGGAQPRP